MAQQPRELYAQKGAAMPNKAFHSTCLLSLRYGSQGG
jgi:hypothetical protein